MCKGDAALTCQSDTYERTVRRVVIRVTRSE